MKEFIYGRNPVYETLRAKRRQMFNLLIAEGAQEKGRLSEILQIAKERKIPVQSVTRARLDKLSDNAQGIAAEVDGYPYVNLVDILSRAERLSEPLFVLILDTIQNPQNLGSLIRTAESVGVHGVVIPGHRAAEVTPAVVSASAGASEHMLITQANLAQAMDELKVAGAWIVGLDEDASSLNPDKVSLTGALAVVVGSEGEGLRSLVKQKCDFILWLPMRGQIESLNAAVAGSVVLYLAFLSRNRS
jgi:23S rRNA (guanosine2251-2'-O)-methyltransferase